MNLSSQDGATVREVLFERLGRRSRADIPPSPSPIGRWSSMTITERSGWPDEAMPRKFQEESDRARSWWPDFCWSAWWRTRMASLLVPPAAALRYPHATEEGVHVLAEGVFRPDPGRPSSRREEQPQRDSNPCLHLERVVTR